MRLAQLRQRLRDLGAASCHEQRVRRSWVQGRSLDTKQRRAEDFSPWRYAMSCLACSMNCADWRGCIPSSPGEDGSARLLVELADGQTMEIVLLPRDGLCVSTQVGCAVGCVFCMTGRADLLRQLSSAETNNRGQTTVSNQIRSTYP